MWNELKDLHAATAARSIVDLFEDSARAETFSRHHDGLLFDFSKTNLDADILKALVALAEETGVASKREAMFRGDKINVTEDRAVLHTAARAIVGDAQDGEIMVDGHDVIAEIRQTHRRMARFARAVRAGDYPAGGVQITDVVNIGIGGSDLGPAMATKALAPYGDGPRCHFVSNVDGGDLVDVVKHLRPETTLVVVASKSFTTQETLMNARSALRWMEEAGGDPTARFVAISTAMDLTRDFGIKPENVFGFGSWIGGRYSVWGPIGLSLMLSIGPERFEEFLRGGLAMDQHFRDAPFDENLPVLLALIGLWHQKVCGYPTRAVIPYEQRLRRLPAYLQQLEMESNGKGVGTDGQPLPMGGGPVVWGEPGTNGQHAFFQLIHQGQDIIPVEFLLGAENHEPSLGHHHRALIANCLAQSEALMKGRTLDEARRQLEDKGMSAEAINEIAPHRVFTGNRPSTSLLYPRLTPYVLGQIIALYEHRVFVEGAILGLYPFDQWGVELGKELANGLMPAVSRRERAEETEGSTLKLLRYIHNVRG